MPASDTFRLAQSFLRAPLKAKRTARPLRRGPAAGPPGAPDPSGRQRQLERASCDIAIQRDGDVEILVVGRQKLAPCQAQHTRWQVVARARRVLDARFLARLFETSRVPCGRLAIGIFG